jgi:hypothetical protein
MTHFAQSQKIQQLVTKAFERIRKDVSMCFNDDYDPEQARIVLRDTVPRLLITETEKLVDTTFNYLMDDALEILKDADIAVKNALFEYDFRNIKKTFEINPESFEFTWTPSKLLCGGAAGATVAILGGGASYSLGAATYTKMAATAGWASKLAFTGIIVGLVGGLVTIVLAATAFKKGADMAVPLSRRKLEDDAESFIAARQKDVTLWLDGLIHQFQMEFKGFCEQKGFRAEGLG